MFNFNREHVQLVKDYHTVFNTDKGQKVLYDLMKTHQAFSTSFDSEALEMARMEGERNVVLRILTLLKESPMKLLEMIDENEKSYDVNTAEKDPMEV